MVLMNSIAPKRQAGSRRRDETTATLTVSAALRLHASRQTKHRVAGEPFTVPHRHQFTLGQRAPRLVGERNAGDQHGGPPGLGDRYPRVAVLRRRVGACAVSLQHPQPGRFGPGFAEFHAPMAVGEECVAVGVQKIRRTERPQVGRCAPMTSTALSSMQIRRHRLHFLAVQRQRAAVHAALRRASAPAASRWGRFKSRSHALSAFAEWRVTHKTRQHQRASFGFGSFGQSLSLPGKSGRGWWVKNSETSTASWSLNTPPCPAGLLRLTANGMLYLTNAAAL